MGRWWMRVTKGEREKRRSEREKEQRILSFCIYLVVIRQVLATKRWSARSSTVIHLFRIHLSNEVNELSTRMSNVGT